MRIRRNRRIRRGVRRKRRVRGVEGREYFKIEQKDDVGGGGRENIFKYQSLSPVLS